MNKFTYKSLTTTTKKLLGSNAMFQKVILVVVGIVILTWILFYFQCHLNEKTKETKQTKFFEDFRNATQMDMVDFFKNGKDNDNYNYDKHFLVESPVFSEFSNESHFQQPYMYNADSPTDHDDVEGFIMGGSNNNVIEGFDLFKKIKNVGKDITKGVEKADPIKEIKKMFDGIGDIIDDKVGGPLKEFGNTINGGFKKVDGVVKTVDKEFKTVGKEFKKVDGAFKTVGKEFKKIGSFFQIVKKRFELFGKSFNTLGVAFNTLFVNTSRSIDLEFGNIGKVLNGGSKCALHFGNNFRRCIIYWIMDLVGEFLYSLFVLFPVWLIETSSGYSLNPWIDQIMKWRNVLDEFIKSFLNISMFHYPDSVLDNCYRCRKVDFGQLINRFNRDNKETIPKLMQEVKGKFNNVDRDFKKTFKP
jgi:hypothetical protein